MSPLIRGSTKGQASMQTKYRTNHPQTTDSHEYLNKQSTSNTIEQAAATSQRDLKGEPTNS